MFKQTNKLAIAALLTLSGVGSATASTLTFNGTHDFASEVDQFQFAVLNGGSISLSSFTNSDFDPTLAIWFQSGSDWSLLAQNDDAHNGYGSGNWADSGITLNNLAAGNYLATVTDYPNWANGNLLSQGFRGQGYYNYGSYTLTVSGDNVAAVPEPEEWAMMMLGLPLMGFVARRKKVVLAA